jgi:hypothetical protein
MRRERGRNGSFTPCIWKTARVTPIFKSDLKSDLNNYRPVSVLPFLSKKLEKHLTHGMKFFLKTKKLLNERQFRFK